VERPRPFLHHRWLGDKRSMRVHDLDRAGPACGIDDLMASGRFAAVAPDVLAEARNRGFRPCPHCARRV
jgi:hypothetical protein